MFTLQQDFDRVELRALQMAGAGPGICAMMSRRGYAHWIRKAEEAIEAEARAASVANPEEGKPA